MDSDLEAFSYYLVDGNFAALYCRTANVASYGPDVAANMSSGRQVEANTVRQLSILPCSLRLEISPYLLYIFQQSLSVGQAVGCHGDKLLSAAAESTKVSSTLLTMDSNCKRTPSSFSWDKEALTKSTISRYRTLECC
jgi:hypothetical protein